MAKTVRKLSLSTAEKEAREQANIDSTVEFLLMQQMQAREEELVNLGFTFDDKFSFYEIADNQNIAAISNNEIKELNDNEWDQRIKDIISEIDRTSEKNIPQAEVIELETAVMPFDKLFTSEEVEAKIIKDLAAIKATCNHKITSLRDKKVYEVIYTQSRLLVKMRTALDKEKGIAKEDLLKQTRLIDARFRKCNAAIVEIEDIVGVELAKWDDLKKAEETRKAREEQEELDRRVNVLKDAGMTFNGFMYVIGEEISINITTLKVLSQDQLNDLVDQVTLEKKRIDDAAEALAKRILEAQEQAESDRIELKRQQDELKENQRIQAEEIRLFNEEKEKMRIAKVEMRKDKCKLLGMQQGVNGMYFSNTISAINIDEQEIWSVDNEVFEHLLSEVTRLIIELKTKQYEKDEADRLKKQQDEADKAKKAEEAQQQFIDRCQQLIQIGMSRENKHPYLLFHNKYGSFQLGFSDIRNAEDFPTMLNNALINIQNLEKKAEQQEINEVNERESAKSDAQRMREYLQKIQAIAAPELTSEAVIKISKPFFSLMGDILNKLEGLEK